MACCKETVADIFLEPIDELERLDTELILEIRDTLIDTFGWTEFQGEQIVTIWSERKKPLKIFSGNVEDCNTYSNMLMENNIIHTVKSNSK